MYFQCLVGSSRRASSRSRCSSRRDVQEALDDARPAGGELGLEALDRPVASRPRPPVDELVDAHRDARPRSGSGRRRRAARPRELRGGCARGSRARAPRPSAALKARTCTPPGSTCPTTWRTVPPLPEVSIPCSTSSRLRVAARAALRRRAAPAASASCSPIGGAPRGPPSCRRRSRASSGCRPPRGPVRTSARGADRSRARPHALACAGAYLAGSPPCAASSGPSPSRPWRSAVPGGVRAARRSTGGADRPCGRREPADGLARHPGLLRLPTPPPRRTGASSARRPVPGGDPRTPAVARLATDRGRVEMSLGGCAGDAAVTAAARWARIRQARPGNEETCPTRRVVVSHGGTRGSWSRCAGRSSSAGSRRSPPPSSSCPGWAAPRRPRSATSSPPTRRPSGRRNGRCSCSGRRWRPTRSRWSATRAGSRAPPSRRSCARPTRPIGRAASAPPRRC